MPDTSPHIFSQKIPEVIFRFSDVFRKAGYQAVLVGGAIRDIILGDTPGDFDFGTDATPQQVMNLFRSVVPTGVAHGTVTVLFQNTAIEVTTFRIDGRYQDNRHPDKVQFSSDLSEDLKRRDFTINALAVALPECRLIDETNGIADIEDKLIRAIGKPLERFEEDALRIWRGLRFSSRLGFRIHHDTLSAMKKTARNIRTIARERIREEWIKLLQGKYVKNGIVPAARFAIMDSVIYIPAPETAAALQSDLPAFADAASDSPLMQAAWEWQWKFAVLLVYPLLLSREERGETSIEDAIDAQTIEAIRTFLKERRYPRQQINALLRKINAIAARPPESDEKISARRYVHMLQQEDWKTAVEARRILGAPECSGSVRQRIQQAIHEGVIYSTAELSINGKDLADALDRAPGPWIGDTLQLLVSAVVDNPEYNKPETLIRLVRDNTAGSTT